MPARRLVWTKVAIVLLLIIGITTALFAILQPVQVLPRLQPVPAFLLTDAGGQTMAAENLAGSLTIVSFISTRDQAAATAVRQLLDLEQSMPQAEPPVKFVLITVDPHHDTPERLQKFAQDLAIATEPSWHLLSGPPNEVSLVVGSGFGVYHAPDPATSGLIRYDRLLILIDEKGFIRGRYPLVYYDSEQLLKHVALLRKEAASSGIATVAYEAAHLFACFPR